MNFELGAEQAALAARVQAFGAAHCPPEVADRIEREAQFPADLYAAMAAEGLLAYGLPGACGGSDGRIIDAVVITESLARYSATAVNLYLVNAVFCGTTLLAAASPPQRERFLPGLGRGELRFAFALTEPGAGSDAGAISTLAVAEDRQWRINGTKLYTTGAEEADFLLVVARTDAQQRARRGSSIFLVPAGTSGLRIRALEKIAGRAFSSCEVQFDDVCVESDLLLGEEAGLHRAWDALARTGSMERICVAASCTGLGQTVFNEARRHALGRVQFGQPIVRFQAVQHRLVDMAIALEAMQLMTYRAATRADRGEMAAREISMAKCFCSEQLTALCQSGMKILGGRAYLEESRMARWLQEGMLSLYAGGTNEIQRNLIARFLGL